MKQIKIWRIIITLIISISLIAIIPWINIVAQSDVKPKYIIYFSLKNFYLINWIILISGFLYFIITLFSNIFQNKAASVFLVFSTIANFSIIIILSFFYHFFIFYTMPLFCLLSIDSSLSIISISKEPAINTQKMQTVVKKQQQVQENIIDNSSNINTTKAKDVSELKNKILNMKSGLSKSYEEAIDEIERTGALNGLDMSELLNEDESQNENKIIPFSIDNQENNRNLDFKINRKFVSSADENLIIQDPLESYSSDYENTQPLNLLDKNYKYNSRRKDIDDSKN